MALPGMGEEWRMFQRDAWGPKPAVRAEVQRGLSEFLFGFAPGPGASQGQPARKGRPPGGLPERGRHGAGRSLLILAAVFGRRECRLGEVVGGDA